MGVLLMRTQGHGDCCLWERRDTMQEDYGTTLLIHQQYYTKTDSPHYNTSSDTYQFFGKITPKKARNSRMMLLF